MFELGTISRKKEGLLGLINVFGIEKNNPSSFVLVFSFGATLLPNECPSLCTQRSRHP